MENEAEYSDKELAEAANETSNQYQGIVLWQAFLIIQHELRFTQKELCEQLHISYRLTRSWKKNGIGITSFYGYLVQLEMLRKK